MKREVITQNGVSVAVVSSPELLISDTGSALDLAMTVQYETDCRRIALFKENITEDFFKLSTCLAGEVLQKYVNYHIKLVTFPATPVGRCMISSTSATVARMCFLLRHRRKQWHDWLGQSIKPRRI